MPDHSRDNGAYVGLVSSLADPDNLGRVKVRYTTLEDQESAWARVASVGAGDGQGLRWTPDVGDQVLIVWVQGDSRWPVVVGSLWNDKAVPPFASVDSVANNLRSMTSRSGHVIVMDDTPGEERIDCIDSTANLSVTLDSRGESVSLVAGDARISLHVDGRIEIKGRRVEIN